MVEGRDGGVADIDVAGEDGDGGGVVGEGDVFVRVCGGDAEGELGVKCGGGGEVEVGEGEGGDGEGRAVGAVEEVEDGAGDADEEEQDENYEDQPEAEAAAEAPAAPPVVVGCGR